MQRNIPPWQPRSPATVQLKSEPQQRWLDVGLLQNHSGQRVRIDDIIRSYLYPITFGRVCIYIYIILFGILDDVSQSGHQIDAPNCWTCQWQPCGLPLEPGPRSCMRQPKLLLGGEPGMPNWDQIKIITQSLAWLLNVLRTGVREVSRSIAADISRTVHRSQIVVITAPGGTWWKRNEILKNPLDPISTY